MPAEAVEADSSSSLSRERLAKVLGAGVKGVTVHMMPSGDGFASSMVKVSVILDQQQDGTQDPVRYLIVKVRRESGE